MRTRTRFIVLSLVFSCLSALALGGCGNEASPPPRAAPEVSVLPVSTRRVELTMELSGRTSALEVAEVRPQVTGIIQKRLFTEGQEVAENQQLYQIDPAVYEAALAEAKASLLQAEANFTMAELTAERHVAAIKVNAVSKQEYDMAIANRSQARASVAAARAAVDTASINMRYTRVNAPIAGHIGISSVTPGALVTANQARPLATIHRIDSMYVDVTQSSAEILRLKRSLMEGRLVSAGDGGARVSLTLEDGRDYGVAGVLQLADISVDMGTGAVTMRAKFENPLREIAPGKKERLLSPGMFVRAVLQEAVNENAVMIPQAAVGRDTMGRSTVYVLLDDGTVAEEIVTIERGIGGEYLISSGLKAGQRLIVDGRIKVRPGAKATAIPYDPAGKGGGRSNPGVSGQSGAPAGQAPASQTRQGG
ncbi:MAG: efflux RND transporter periplasmic adaptor subunit [Deltaproteobacteria bacterium]|jgi:membrane fusion protein (multidrug efflux system)|nr:efflux RND transporter periplasmic adaptor subunit [Deltaproteobacteria bacterium]